MSLPRPDLKTQSSSVNADDCLSRSMFRHKGINEGLDTLYTQPLVTDSRYKSHPPKHPASTETLRTTRAGIGPVRLARSNIDSETCRAEALFQIARPASHPIHPTNTPTPPRCYPFTQILSQALSNTFLLELSVPLASRFDDGNG